LAARQTTVALSKHGLNLRPVASHDEVGGGAGPKELGQQANMCGVVEDPARAHDSGRGWPPSRHRMEKLMGGVREWTGMSKIGITPAGSKTYAPYTPAVVVGNHVWLSGQINIDAGDDIVSQTQGTLDKIDALLAEAGTSKHDLVVVQVLLKTMEYYAPMNDVYGAWLEGVEVKPTRAAFAVDALPADALVEIVVQAVKSD
jgi:enamine deaminase RidA (YjgF/YER057c/UK114 family)